jgi:hypothetical protein
LGPIPIFGLRTPLCYKYHSNMICPSALHPYQKPVIIRFQTLWSSPCHHILKQHQVAKGPSDIHERWYFVKLVHQLGPSIVEEPVPLNPQVNKGKGAANGFRKQAPCLFHLLDRHLSHHHIVSHGLGSN